MDGILEKKSTRTRTHTHPHTHAHTRTRTHTHTHTHTPHTHIYATCCVVHCEGSQLLVWLVPRVQFRAYGHQFVETDHEMVIGNVSG